MSHQARPSILRRVQLRLHENIGSSHVGFQSLLWKCNAGHCNRQGSCKTHEQVERQK
jgi:hypothetical protein